ncbi:MAG: hypothetical protein HYZ39_18640 [Mycolicibacterium cosmeticum]|nr:hypothetical protein [Mycolicibacterium cosmeticum]
MQVAFSPRAIRQMTDYVGQLSDALVDQIREAREFDFVDTVGACPAPSADAVTPPG